MDLLNVIEGSFRLFFVVHVDDVGLVELSGDNCLDFVDLVMDVVNEVVEEIERGVHVGVDALADDFVVSLELHAD